MMKRSTLAVGLIVLLLSGGVYALDPLGPPKAIVGRNNWSLGAEYAFSDTNSELSNVVFQGAPVRDLPSKGFKASRVYATPRYGVLDNVDVFGRIGAIGLVESPVLRIEPFVGDVGPAWGFGAAATVYDSDRLDWGVVAQWSRSRTEEDQYGITANVHRKLEVDSLQIATGPTYGIREDLSLYGGVFYHALDGEFEDPTAQFDMEEDNPLGGFGGLDWAVKENVHWTLEMQSTSTAFAVATGLKWLFP